MGDASLLRKAIRRHGAFRTALAGGLACTVVSAAICFPTFHAFAVPLTPVLIALPVVVPLIIAPVTLYAFARLVRDLDATERRLSEREEALSEEVAERRKAEEALRQSEAELRSILDNMAEVYYRTDIDGTILKVAGSLEEAAGWTPEEVLGKPIADYYADTEDARERFLTALEEGGGQVTDYEVPMLRKDGSVVWASVNARVCRDENGKAVAVEGMVRDVSHLVHTSRKLEHMANHDPLTGVANRSLFLQQVSLALWRASRYDQSGAVLYVRVEGTDEVVSRLGRGAGDWALAEAAQRLRGCVRECDLVARLSGSTFGVVLENVRQAPSAQAVAAKLIERMAEPFRRGDQAATVTAMIGGAVFDGGGVTLDAVLATAERALDEAAGGSGTRIVDLLRENAA
jgi:PAS domain S-box-containing protein/diguanylate cyclase (GGDEF)-like protein